MSSRDTHSGPRMLPALPAASSIAIRFAMQAGQAVAAERTRRRWTTRQLARRARVSASSVSNVEAGRQASLGVYARLAAALGLVFEIGRPSDRRQGSRRQTDLVHSAMGETWAGLLSAPGYALAIDHPYQHYQFAGRADVMAWTLDPPALLHIENRTRFPDLQAAAGSYNAKRQYLAGSVARQLGIRRFESQTHVMAALWSAEVIHRVRTRRTTFGALCPDGDERLLAWLNVTPPKDGASSSLVLLDPLAAGRKVRWVGLAHALDGERPRVRDYREAAERLRAQQRA